MRVWVIQLAHLTVLLAPLVIYDIKVMAQQGVSIWNEEFPDFSPIELLELRNMQENTRCPHDCFEHIGRGYCVDGVCECTKHYIGDDCSRERTNCPSDCSFNGNCQDGICDCYSGWSGEDCSSFQRCPRDCSGRGVCINGKCSCDEGFLGNECARFSPSTCPASCFGRGVCVNGKCHCDRGYTGISCSIVQLCVEAKPEDFSLCASLLHDPRDKYYIATGFDIAIAEQKVLENSRAVNDSCTGKSLGREMALNILCGQHIPFCHPTTQREVKACLHECVEAAQICGLEVSTFCPSSRFFDSSEESVPPYNFRHHPGKYQPKCKEIYLPGDKLCPKNCSGHGSCDTQDGVCLCDHKWKGVDCAIPDCPRNCSRHGLCLGDPTPGVCKCDIDWTLEDCSLKRCSNDCSGPSHGRCNNGTCNCLNPWSSVDCSIPVCPKNCSYHGECLSKPAGVCKCDPGYFGEDCSKRKCPNDCSGHGHCDTSTGLCSCDTPWTQEDCSRAVCPSDCSGHGLCQQSRANPGKCLCDTPWFTEDCSMKGCPHNCSDHGLCDHTTGICDCNHLYYAEDCSKKHCPNDCFDTHGICNDNGTCECFSPWGHADCGRALCPNNCSSHGECLQTTQDAGKCYCDFPWSTLDCSVARCPNNCSNHGECLQKQPDHGKCACDEPWIGSDCSVSLCPNGCSGHGRCKDGKCSCFNPWFTEDCSVAMCPENCTSPDHGMCDPDSGVCSCFEPFTGINCSYALCPDDCSHNGYCDRATGYCTCDFPWYGDSCSMQPCPSDCSGHGECNTANGRCLCDEFWHGEACDKVVPSLSPGASLSATPSVSPSVGTQLGESSVPNEQTIPSGTPESTPTISSSLSSTTSLSVGMSVSASVSESLSLSVSATPAPSITQSLGASPSTDIRCSHDCSGHGECSTGTGICTCNSKWSAEDCSMPLCENDCNGHGRCVEPDLCICEEGFDGDLCQFSFCKNKCTGHGECDLGSGVCVCDEGWENDDCSEEMCPNDCAGNGECENGVCRCKMGWTSADCSLKECPNSCMNHGVCEEGVCICNAPFQGKDCSEIPVGELPQPTCDCNGRGTCEGGVCQCDSGFTGPTCLGKGCVPACQNAGVCNLKTGNCTCPEPFHGGDCSMRRCENCVRGVCQSNGTCLCDGGYFGPNCDEFSCSEDCNNHGICTAPDVCECMEGWLGFNCSTPICPGDPGCSNHGKCIGPFNCDCEIGWTGNACEERIPCPNDCSGQGECDDGVCLCEPDWMGADCSVYEERSCKDVEQGCGGYGVCSCEGKCECMPGFVGRLCQRPARCNNGCSGRGQCVQDNVCKCYEGFSGKTCNIDTTARTLVITECLDDCSGQGYCGATGECSCFVGFAGANCSLVHPTECPNSCSNNGLCEMYEDSSAPECICGQGWTGMACDEFDEICPKNCSCNGVCLNDQCECDPGFYGPMCELRTCPNNCSNHGECDNGLCKCHVPWYEYDCSVAMCPYNCSKHGVCEKSTGVCTCDPGYYGDDCTSLICPGTPECSDHGVCENRTGVCACHTGWHGDACECKSCPLNCTSRGECDCDTGTCACAPPYYGRACEFVPCPNNCSGNGLCNNRTGKCKCATMWKELDCSVKMCPGEDKDLICSHHGFCENLNKTCDCDPGWAGFDCSQIARTTCPKDCSGLDHGTCANGECVCKEGWTGPSCSIADEVCPDHEGQTCNNKGSCLRGKCFCVNGWSGESCEVAEFEECPRNCSNHGVCVDGICKCAWDWVGSACQKYRCPNGCSKHGFCNKNSTCTCDHGWEILQPDCSEGPHFLCTPECVNGHCNHTVGKCVCDEGYEGPTCEVEVCPKRCHLEGNCLTGVCDCNNGYVSDDCGVVDMGPNFCSGKGLYNRDTGGCECAEGFEGEDCSLTHIDGAFNILCMTNCTAMGICDGTENATCTCKGGWAGVDCSERVEKCPLKCHGHGVCTKDTKCFCAPMYLGDSCEGYLTGFEENDISVLGPARECPQQCGEHGVCSDTGECQCYGGGFSSVQAFWAGEDCLEGHCANDCSGHGNCETNYVCNCTDFWSGWTCEIEPPPCLGCSGRGDCDCFERVVFEDKDQCKCDCHTGYQGTNCEEVIPCPIYNELECGGRGVCILGECVCNRGFLGIDCSETNITAAKPCPAKGVLVCGGNGLCLISGECDCFPGWTANDCSVKITDCPYSCNGQGECNDNLGSCTCFEEFENVDCSGFVNYEVSLMPCQQNCTGHGMCCNGRCKCLDGWKGSSCSIPASICPNHCSGNGICHDTDQCECAEGYSGEDCSHGPVKPSRCPRNCMGNGICNPGTGRCDCLYDFEGADCSISAPRCTNNCSGNGECYSIGQGVSGGEGSICECLDGYGGFDCSIPLSEDLDMTHCPSNCSGHGVCLDYQCYCSQDYRGAACSFMDRRCPDSCSGFGVCEDGCCNCVEEYKGVTCGLGPEGKLPDEPVCRNNCTGHGMCNSENRRCDCIDPFVYEDCSVLTEDCPGNCNGRGECLLGKCACDFGFSGAGCDINVAEEKSISDDEGYKRGLRDSFYNKTLECPLGCSAHGSCDGETGLCHCWESENTGVGCEFGDEHLIECPKNCSGHGECIDGQCSCDIGYFGVSCQNMNMPCPFHCSGKGICTDGECRCFDGYFGDGCESPTYAPYCAMNCTGQGECLEGDCHCPTGFRGIDCSISIGKCKHGCSGRGMCGLDNACICSGGYSGADCNIADSTMINAYPDCPRNCSGKGICELGACVCDPDQGHYDCGVTVFICPRGCSGQGVCVAGECQCNAGFMGEDCNGDTFQHTCPMNCSGRGQCVNGFCECRFPWVGEDCSRVGVCPGDCSGHGVCEGVCGTCSCFSSWGGADCSVQGGCPNDCSGNGNCTEGICLCDSLFTGPDCSVGKDLIDLCNSLNHIVPDFWGVECDGLNETIILTAVSNRWDTEPADNQAARIFRAMQQGLCSDRAWRLRNRIVLIARRIHSQTPSAITRYEDIKENAMDICYIHSLFEPRMLLYETRDDPKTPAFAANDITMLIQECNTYLAELFETPKRDELRRLRDKIKKFAIDITNLDPNVLNFESLTIDELLCQMADHGNAAMLMSKAADSIEGVVELAGYMLISIGTANDLLEYAKNHVSEAIDELYSMELLSKYFSEVFDMIDDSQLVQSPGVGALAQIRTRSSNPIAMIEITALDSEVIYAANGEWVIVGAGNKLLNVGTPFPAYDLHFEVEVLEGGADFGSILQIGDGDPENANTRCPGFLLENVADGRMGVSVMNVDGQLEECEVHLSVGIHKIATHVTTSGMKVAVDGVKACSLVSEISCPLINAAIYAGHPGLHPAAARVRNVVYANLPGTDGEPIGTPKKDVAENSDISAILPHHLDLPSLIVTMVEENTGEKARDAIFGQPENSRERLAVIKLIAGLNVASARGVSEMPELSILFETRSKIKMFTVTLYKLDPTAIEDPSSLTADDITSLLINPATKAKLRQLQLQPALYTTISLLLHEINTYQSYQSFMIAEAKRIAFILRALDETIVPDLSTLSATQNSVQEKTEKGTKVVYLSKAINYIDSLEVYMQTPDLDKSAELQNDVTQFLELMKALGGALPFSAVSFLDLFAQRLIIIDLYNLLVEHAGLGKVPIVIDSSTTIEVINAIKAPSYLEQIRQIAENVPSLEDVSSEEYNTALESSKTAEQILLALEAIDENAFNAIALLKIIGEGLNRMSSVAGKGVVFPDSAGKPSLEYCSEVYDNPIWDVLRTTDSAFRMQESNSTDVESDKQELMMILKQAASSGDINNWGVQVHAVVDLVTGLLGIGDTEVLIREAMIHMSEAEKILSDFKQVHPETCDELIGLIRPASLSGKYEKGESAVYQGTDLPPLSLILNHFEVEGLPKSFEKYCPNCAASLPHILVEGSFCHHYGVAADPMYHEKLGPRPTHDSAGLAVRCCTEEGDAVHTDQSGGCITSVTYMQAVGACRAHNFRLCSLEELQDGRSIGMGCGFDRRRVWTSTGVGSCEAESRGSDEYSQDSIHSDFTIQHQPLVDPVTGKHIVDTTYASGGSLQLVGTTAEDGSGGMAEAGQAEVGQAEEAVVTPSNTAKSISPDFSSNPVDDMYLLARLEMLLSRVAELTSVLRPLVVPYVLAIRENHPESVPSIVGLDIPPDGKLVMETLATKDAVQTMIRSLNDVPHGEARVDLNNVIQVVKLFSSGFTNLLTVPPGEESLATMDYNKVPTSECSNSGTKFDGQCICNGFSTGVSCEQTNSWDQAYQSGWHQGWEASLSTTAEHSKHPSLSKDVIPGSNMTEHSSLSNVTDHSSLSNVTEHPSSGSLVLNTATVFDRAAQQLKTTSIAMGKIDPQCEISVPTSYLSAIEIMRKIEDSGWLEVYRACPNSQFRAVIPKLLKEVALVRREYDDIATMLKQLVIKASILDCEAMKIVAITPNGEIPACGAVVQTVTTTDKAQVLEKCMTEPVMMELQNMLGMEHSTAMKHIVDDTLELVNAIQRHTQCPGQCSKRGYCIIQACQCFEGWMGVACTHEARLPDGMCPRNCSNHGKCLDGKCKCDPGWKSYDCSFSTACPNDCYDHGDCIDGQCHCFRRWRGFDCSLPREICPDDFNCYHGVCRNNQCICEKGWTGDDCTIGDFHAKESDDGFWESDMAETAVFLQSGGSSSSGHANMAYPWL